MQFVSSPNSTLKMQEDLYVTEISAIIKISLAINYVNKHQVSPDFCLLHTCTPTLRTTDFDNTHRYLPRIF